MEGEGHETRLCHDRCRDNKNGRVVRKSCLILLYNTRIFFFLYYKTTTTPTIIIILDFVVIVVKYCEETKVSLHLRCSVIIVVIVIVIVIVIINAGWSYVRRKRSETIPQITETIENNKSN